MDNFRSSIAPLIKSYVDFKRSLDTSFNIPMFSAIWTGFFVNMHMNLWVSVKKY